ncbi:hypothetical protein FSP39_022221 [Pinctada imbricata]|uniref:Protogenin n=1 Tax=Pinctada imbricata TaxID=66713 RepID=A0AA89C1Y0_PINIB|nr:hypothetical protein FSP39_022221 [Pinctada imbricata]
MFLNTGDIELDLGVVIQPAPPTVIAQKSFPFLLNCSAYSGPEYRPINYTWYKDGAPISLSRRIKLVNNGSLYFHSIKRRKRRKNLNDQGFYECFLTNSQGTVIARQVELKIARIAKKFKTEPTNQTVVEGGVARFECDIDSSPFPRYIWKKDGNTIQNDPRFIELASGILQIDNVRMSDIGSYYCSAHQSFTSLVTKGSVAISSPIWRHSKEAKLMVLPASGHRAPSIVAATEVVNATVDSTVLLECFADGDPKPTITWQKKAEEDGKPDSPVLEDVHKRRIGNGNLKFIEVSGIDEGIYKCTASAPGYSDAVALVNLNVLKPPKLINTPISSSYPLSQRVRLKCEATGEPEPSITWYKNGRLVTPNGHIMLNANELLIESRKSDSGYYQCMAKNRVGTVMTTARLKITLGENAPIAPQFVKAEPLSPTVMNVSWSASEYSDCCPVIGYTLHYNNSQSNTDDKVLSLTTVVQITNLQPYTLYKFYVQAYSTTGGASLGSPVVLARTLEGVPSAAPRVNLSSLTSTTIDVKWWPLKEHQRNGRITKYKIVYKEADKDEKTEEVPANTIHYVITGLNPGREYSVRVLAATSQGYPNLSEEKWPWMYQVTKSNIVTGMSTPKLEIVQLNATSVLVTWDVKNTSKQIKVFRLYIRRMIGQSVSDVYQIGSSIRNYTLTGLENKMFYKAILMVEGQGQTLGIVNRLFQALEPGSPPEPPPPSEIESLAITPHTMLIKWNRPRVNMEITRYTVRYHNAVDLQKINYAISDERSVRLENLQPFTEYFISVRSHSQTNYGPFSNTIRVRTKEDVPDAPQDIRLVPLQDGMVELNWKPPAKQNGIIIFYVIQYNKELDVRDELWQSLQKNGTKTTAVVGDLTGTVYYFKVRACTKAGLGPSSGVVQISLSCPVNCDKNNIDHSPTRPSESPRPMKDQRLGIIIGCTIGISSILICILVIILRQRRYAAMYAQSNQHIVTTTTNGNMYQCAAQRMANYATTNNDATTPMLRESIHFDSKGDGPDVIVKRNGQVMYLHSGKKANGRVQTIAESRPLMTPHSENTDVQEECLSKTQSTPSVGVTPDSIQADSYCSAQTDAAQTHHTAHNMDTDKNEDADSGSSDKSKEESRDSSLKNFSSAENVEENMKINGEGYSGNDILSKMLEATSSNIDTPVDSPPFPSSESQAQKTSGNSYGSSSHESSLPQKSRSKAQKRS